MTDGFDIALGSASSSIVTLSDTPAENLGQATQLILARKAAEQPVGEWAGVDVEPWKLEDALNG